MKIGCVGLLATDGVLATGIYDDMLMRFKIEFMKPTPKEQVGVKAFLLDCTELPIAFERFNFPNSFINPTAILAEYAIVLAGGQVDEKRRGLGLSMSNENMSELLKVSA